MGTAIPPTPGVSMDLRFRSDVTSWRIADERGDLVRRASNPGFELGV
jgi:hypothetical protein